MLWDLKAGKTLHQWDGAGYLLAFSPDGKRLVAGDVLMRCWDVETGQSVWPDFGPLLGGNIGHGPLVSRPAGKLIVTWDPDAHRVQVWDWTTGRPVFGATVVGENCEALWITPDGARLHVCTNKRVQGWDLATGKELHRFTPVPTQLIGDDWYLNTARESDGQSISVLLYPLRT